ncbi:MAG: hypothetical protein A2X71_08175 [Thiobacillus sp. GWE1_62_9]|nr:MAG: hypothetical protein A2X71_08175 [Thiobacillus sp. GWE1_62_9]
MAMQSTRYGWAQVSAYAWTCLGVMRSTCRLMVSNSSRDSVLRPGLKRTWIRLAAGMPRFSR